jgi:phosphate starvation-inducible protein PhoH
VQQVLDVSNDVAVELAGIGDGVLEALRDRLRCTILLRGNRLTIEGEEPNVSEARAVVDEIVELVESGQEIGPTTVDSVLHAIDQADWTASRVISGSPQMTNATPLIAARCCETSLVNAASSPSAARRTTVAGMGRSCTAISTI